MSPHSTPPCASCTPARLHAYTRSGNEHTVGYQIQKNISFKKTFKLLKRWATLQAVPQVNRTALNTVLLVGLLVLR
jgi:hypothetical protein